MIEAGSLNDVMAIAKEHASLGYYEMKDDVYVLTDEKGKREVRM